MADDASDPATDRKPRSGSASAIADRTASDVFASLAADGPAVDTDAILDGTSPDEIIERTTDPGPASSVDSSLYDEAELTELILPDRQSDGTFCWVETPESASPSDAESAAASDPESTERSETSSIRTWQDTDHDGSDTATTPPSTAMTDPSDSRRAHEPNRTTSTAHSTGFDIDDQPTAGKVPPRTETSTTDTDAPPGESAGSSPERNRRDSPPSARESGSGPQAQPAPDGEAASKSEIRTTVQYLDGRNPDATSPGRLASIKRLVSRVFRPGRSG